MKLPEYKAKELFAKYGIKIMKGIVTDSAENTAEEISAAKISYPVVIKAQVPIGGRGKAGGVKFAENESEMQNIAKTMLLSSIKGYAVDKILIAEKLECEDEWYLSVMIDRAAKCPLVIFSPSGGIDIEETAKTSPKSIVKIHINPLVGIKDYTVRYIIDKSGVPQSYFGELEATLKKLYDVFCGYSCLLAEINPLALPKSGDGLVAIDGKVEIDDSAAKNFPDIDEFAKSQKIDPKIKEAAMFNFLYIPIEQGGEVGVMSNGSGMLMSCIDQFAEKGIKVGAALDLGGGATAERIKEAVRIMLGGEGIHTLFVSIFGGITRCDEVASGVKAALADIGEDKSVVLRMEGTNKEKGFEIIQTETKISVAGDIPSGVRIISEKLHEARCGN